MSVRIEGDVIFLEGECGVEDAEPLVRAPRGSSPRIAREVSDFPDPDSPTRPTVSPGLCSTISAMMPPWPPDNCSRSQASRPLRISMEEAGL